MPATIEPAVATYLEEALVAIADVQGDAHQELADAIEEAILEVAEESEGNLEEVLGEPSDFVAELRAASGFGPSGRVGKRRFQRLRSTISQQTATMKESTSYRWTGQLLGELQPAWWVARGYVVAFVLTFYLSWLVAPQWGRVLWLLSIPLPRLLPGVLALPALIAFIVISVQIGRRTYSGWRKSLVMLLNVLTVVGMLGLSGSLESRYNSQAVTDVHAVEVSEFEPRLPITLIAPGWDPIAAFTFDEAISLWIRLREDFDPGAIQIITPNGEVESFQTDNDLADFLRGQLFGRPVFIDP